MPSQRERIRMTDGEAAEFLATERTVQVASIGPDGTPHLVPMWFAVIDGRIAFWTFAKSQKALNLRRDPRGVSITGRAEVADDYDTVFDVGSAVYARYMGDMNHASRQGVEHEARKRVAVFVIPEKTASWDHRKL
jgi:nitroimidazol reductase NimA-like FMN-containing flavoprotein (pyridoxamine 5'-phosphate oxidase superfamily)